MAGRPGDDGNDGNDGGKVVEELRGGPSFEKEGPPRTLPKKTSMTDIKALHYPGG